MLSASYAPADDPEAFPWGGCGVKAVRQVDAAQPSTTAQKGGFGVRAPAPQSIRRRSIFMLTSTLVVEFLSRSAVSGCGGVEVVIGSNRLRWSCKTFT